MNNFTADYLANLTADLTAQVLGAAGRRVREALQGTEEEQALRRCVEAGLVALLAKVSHDIPEEQDIDHALLQSIFTPFFHDPDVARELSQLLQGRRLNMDELCYLFAAAGYDAATLPGLDFETGVRAFEAAFVEAAITEDALQDQIQTGNLVAQTRAQRALLAEVRALLAWLREHVRPGSVGIQAGQIYADNVVNGQQIIYHWHAPGEQSVTSRSARQAYLRELAREVNRLPWTTVARDYADPEGGEAPGLVEVYTALDTTELEHVACEADLRAFMAGLARGETRRVPAQEVLDAEDRLLILGDPGAGKSTLVNYLAYVLAQAGLAQEPAPWLERLDPWTHGPLLPVRVALRDMAAWWAQQDEAKAQNGNPVLAYLPALLDRWHLDDTWPFLREAVQGEETTLLILLDGLDEVPTDQRGRVVAAVQAFADRYSRHRYVVTCRPYAYVGQPWQLHGFREVTLAPFSEAQIDAFIAAWYRELAAQGRLAAHEAAQQTAYLQGAVRRRDLEGLAQRPLLLTVMAWLHTFQGRLPDDRTELYAEAVDLLLRRWERRVGGEEGLLARLNVPGLKMRDLQAGLYAVAFRAHSATAEAEGTADVDEADLRKWLAPYLGGSWDDAWDFVTYIRERAGLLIPRGDGAYTFPHRTFQEFMAACHMVGVEDYPREAARLLLADPVRWREVFILAAGHAARVQRPGSATAAVNALCPQAVTEVQDPDAVAFRLAQVAGEALLEIGMVGVERDRVGGVVLDRVRQWLAAALEADSVLEARSRADAGDVLAKLGDLRPGVGMVKVASGVTLPDIVWCEVPAGPFTMGSEDNSLAWGKETPQHKVDVPLYWISRYPITNAQFSAFVEAGGYADPVYWTDSAREEVWKDGKVKGRGDHEPRVGPYDLGAPFTLPNHPVVGVTWYEAVAFCRWLTKQMRKVAIPLKVWREGRVVTLDLRCVEVTLPSEVQWEKARVARPRASARAL